MSSPFALSEYLASGSIYSKGRQITRQQVIQYVAHKKGGAHWDTKRKDDDDAAWALDDLGDISIGGRADAKGNIVDKSKSPIFFELLSIGQNVSRSPDIQRLVAEADKI